MNAALALSLALFGPCGSVHEPAEPDAIALVEVVGEFSQNPQWGFTTSSWGLHHGTRAVVVKAVAEGELVIGQRLELKTVRPWADPPEVRIDREPLRLFGVDLYVGRQLDGWPNEKCSLPDGSTGQQVFVALEEGRLVDWWLPESSDTPGPERESFFDQHGRIRVLVSVPDHYDPHQDCSCKSIADRLEHTPFVVAFDDT